MKPIVIVGLDWRIPPVTGDTLSLDAVCMEAVGEFTTDRMYVSCGEPATIRLWDNRAGRAYDFCQAHGEHNLRRGMNQMKLVLRVNAADMDWLVWYAVAPLLAVAGTVAITWWAL